MELYDFPAHELHEMLKNKEISCCELTAAVLKRQEQCEPLLKAFVSFTPETAMETADQVDQKIAGGEEIGPLEGIPIALKDNLCTEGIKTTCSSKMLENFIPPYNATVVEKLKEAGVVLTGKLNMDEFAMGSSTENSAFFTTRNPWDTSRVPGGSSGGSVTAVAAGEAIFALGSDTGGSIRQPAAFCGVVGLKPTYGRVSRYGLVAFASSLDQIGPVTRDVKDTALVLKAISGHDPFDSTSAPLDVPDYLASIEQGVKGMKIGIPKEYFAAGLEPAVEQAVQKAIKQMEELGAVCEETTMPHTEYALPTYYLVAPAEASSNLARYDGVSYGFRAPEAQDTLAMMMQTRSQGFGAEVKRRIMLGTYALSSGYYDAYYLKALKVRTLIKQDFDKAFEKYDLLLTPTTPTTAFKIGEKTDDPLAMYLSDLLTVPVNMAGVPAISLTCGYQDRLPVGLQLIGKPFGEETILQAAYAFEQANDYYRRRPELEVCQ